MSYCKINGTEFDVTVSISSYEENFNVLDGSNAGRVMSGRMIRDIIGTYIGHSITFYNNGNNAAFDALWEYLKAHSVDDCVLLEAADGQSTISYEANYTSASRKLRRVYNGVNYWDALDVNFIPMDPQVTP